MRRQLVTSDFIPSVSNERQSAGAPQSHEVTPHNSPEPEHREASGFSNAPSTPPKEPNRSFIAVASAEPRNLALLTSHFSLLTSHFSLLTSPGVTNPAESTNLLASSTLMLLGLIFSFSIRIRNPVSGLGLVGTKTEVSPSHSECS